MSHGIKSSHADYGNRSGLLNRPIKLYRHDLALQRVPIQRKNRMQNTAINPTRPLQSTAKGTSPVRWSYEPWRHGGWYVHNTRYPNGGCGCVSRNYPDKKWRIVCDPRRKNLNEPGDFTFRSRDLAAQAEFDLVEQMKADAQLASPEGASQCIQCDAVTPSVNGCPDGAEVCAECFEATEH